MKIIRSKLVVVLFALSACGPAGSSAKTILVDYSHDEFSSYFIKYFPAELSVNQGDELVFKQTWTGEPHTVTGGTLVNEFMTAVKPYIELEKQGKPLPDEAPPEVVPLEKKLVSVFGESEGLNQTAAQPCYLDSGEPRKDGKPCPKREQPEFTGKQSYFNSGVIPYEGPQGNEYRVKLSDDIDPGTYFFYCAVHPPFQYTELEVKARGEKVDSPEEINRRAASEIDKIATPSLSLYRDAAAKNSVNVDGKSIDGPFAGLSIPDSHDAAINEFVPKQLSVRAGAQVKWKLFGAHSISFSVPRYFPIVEFKPDGSVDMNPATSEAAGGAPPVPEEEFHDSSGEGPPPTSEPKIIDGGTFDGDGFWSTGVIYAEPYAEYSIRFSQPGTFRFACLIHPPMVGTLEVTKA